MQIIKVSIWRDNDYGESRRYTTILFIVPTRIEVSDFKESFINAYNSFDNDTGNLEKFLNFFIKDKDFSWEYEKPEDFGFDFDNGYEQIF